MFASNNKISVRQVYRLFVFDLIGISTLVLPSRLAYFSDSDGLLAIIIGGASASAYLWYLGKIIAGMKMDVTSYLEAYLPTWLTKLILGFLGLHAVWAAGFGAYIFADVMKLGLLPEESYTLLLTLILIVAAYAVHGGIESRARIYEVLFVLLAVLLFLMLLLAAFDIQWDYIGPFFDSAPGNTMKGSILVFFCFMPLFAVLFFPAYVEKGREKKMVRAVFAALWSAVLVLFVLYFILLGSFGSKALQTMHYPAVTLMSNIHLRSSFLKRFDAFMLGIWFFTLFALINLFLFYGTELLMRLFVPSGRQSRGYIWYLLGITVMVFAAAELFYYRGWSGFFQNYVCYVGMPLLVLLPGLILVVGKSRGVRKR